MATYRTSCAASGSKEMMMFTATTREISKLATHGLTRKLIIAGLAASVIFGAVAEAQAKMVCYKDPGRGMVCTKVK